MDSGNWASVLVAVLMSFGGWAASRASARAAIQNAQATAAAAVKNAETQAQTQVETARAQAESDAYGRARKLDVETIERQDKELKEMLEQIKEVKEQNEHLNKDVKMVHDENQTLVAQNKVLLEQNERILADNKELRAEIGKLRQRQTKVERGIDPDSPEPVKERESDHHPFARAGDDDPMMREVHDYG